MSNEVSLRGLWVMQETAAPDINEVFKKANAYKKKNIYMLVFANLCLLLTTVSILYMWYYYQPKLITTKIGIATVILAMVMYITVCNRMIPFLRHVPYNMSTRTYLLQLVKLRSRQAILQKTVLNIYFILLSAGICLYIFEYVIRMSLPVAITCYALTLAWILVNWFYFRPRVIKKQQGQINSLIKEFRKINEQLERE